MSLRDRFRGNHGDHPLARWVDVELSYGRNVVDRFLRQVAPFDLLVDLGAGWGQDLQLARAASPSARLEAVEFFEPQLPRLRAVADGVVQADIEHDPLPYADESVDVFIANQVLEHTKEVFWILHEVSRTLRVGGHLIIGVPNIASFHNRMLLLAGQHPTQIQLASAHVRGFSRRDLMRFFDKCFPGGYEQVEWDGAQFYPFPRDLARLLARLAPGLAYSLFVLLRKQAPYGREILDYPATAELQTRYHLG